MVRRVVLGLALFMNLLPAGAVLAETTKSNETPSTLDAIEVTSERISEYIKNHPQDVAVVKRKEITERNLLSAEEVLKTMPGVEVHQSAGVASRISIRGSGKSGGILILLNGRPLNTNQYGGTDLSAIPVDIIESITVFKPPVPVWLGPGASEGAISIITRDLTPATEGKKEPVSNLRVGIGSFGFADGSLSHAIPVAGGNTLFTATATHRDGKRENSDSNSGNLSAFWTREGRDGTKYEINGRYYLAEYGSPGPTDNPTPDARQRYEKGSFDAKVAGIIGEAGGYSVNPYADFTTLKDRSQTGYTSNLDDLKTGVKSEMTWADKRGSWDMRIGSILERDDIDHTMTGKHHRTMGDISSQYDRRFGPLTGTIGLRGNYTDDFSFNPGFSGGVGYAAAKGVLIRAKAGYVVNVPTFGQLYQTSHGSIDQVRGNPDLKEEKIWSYDLGIEYTFGKEKFFQAALFRADTSNLISSRRGADRIYRPVNVNRAWRHGVEMTFKYLWAGGLAVNVNGILQKSRNSDTGKDLPYTPGITAKTTLQYTIAPWKTRLEVVGRYEGSRYSEAEGLASQRLDDYVAVDLKITRPLMAKGCTGQWFVRVDNLFNTPFEVHYAHPDDGIRFMTGIQVRF